MTNNQVYIRNITIVLKTIKTLNMSNQA